MWTSPRRLGVGTIVTVIAPIAIALTTCAARAQTSRPAPFPADRAAGAEAIDAQRLRAHLTRLTSTECAGRGTGQEGFAQAADYFEGRLRAAGLEPLVGDTYRMEVPWIRIEPDPEETWLAVRRGDEELLRLTVADGLQATATGDAAFDGPLVVLPVDATEEALDDFDLEAAGLKKDDAVLVVAREPWKSRRSYDRLSSRIRRAGARLYAVANERLAAALPTRAASIPGSGNRIAASRGRLPRRVVLDDALRDRLLESIGLSLDPRTRADGRAVRPGGDLTLECRAQVRETTAPAWNVGAILPGRDPALRDEYVVVGCHLDHLGRVGETVYPGADDDGSGSAGVLALAEAFAENGRRPRRSLLFVAFCGEEKGLVGSAHFSRNSPVPLGAIAAELQLDMIGRSEEHARTGETADQNRNVLHLVGTEMLSTELHRLCMDLNRERARFDLEWDEERVFYRSDHWNFARYGVPVAFFFTGFHEDYHRPTDTIDKIEFDKLSRVVRYVYDIAFELAERERRPHVELELWERLEKKGRKDPVAPVEKAD